MKKVNIPIVILIIGLALLVFKIIVDSEPGALPLFLIVISIGWLSFKRLKSPAKTNTDHFNK